MSIFSLQPRNKAEAACESPEHCSDRWPRPLTFTTTFRFVFNIFWKLAGEDKVDDTRLEKKKKKKKLKISIKNKAYVSSASTLLRCVKSWLMGFIYFQQHCSCSIINEMNECKTLLLVHSVSADKNGHQKNFFVARRDVPGSKCSPDF